MKSWDVSSDIRDDPELFAVIDRTRSVIEDVLGISALRVSARWSATAHPDGRRSLVLNLSDWTWPEGVEARFRVGEVQPDRAFRRTVHRLWGDLLQARNHRQLAQLQAGE